MKVHAYRGVVITFALAGCSNERPPPAPHAAESPRQVEVETAKHIDYPSAYRAKLSHGAELYLPTWFGGGREGYDVIVHFHGLGKLQEHNIETTKIDAAMVSLNRGVGSDAYARAFADGADFNAFLAEVDAEIAKAGRAGKNGHRRRLALTAWSAGAITVSKLMQDQAVFDEVDAVLLADGLFTSFTNVQKRTMNTAPLDKWVAYADLAKKNERMLAITHTAIPTGDYPSVTEVVGKLLEMDHVDKTATSAEVIPHMKETFTVDTGSLHVKGYDGLLAGDHIRQIQEMGRTLYPHLLARWERSAPPSAPTK